MELLKKICPFSFCRDLQRRILLAQLLDRLRILLLDRTSPLPTILDMTEGEKIMLNENSKYQNYHFEPVDLKSLYYWKEQHVYRLNIVFTKKVHFFKFKFSFWTHYLFFCYFYGMKTSSQPADWPRGATITRISNCLLSGWCRKIYWSCNSFSLLLLSWIIT